MLHVKKYDLMLTIVLMMSGSGSRISGARKMINKRHHRLIIAIRRKIVVIV